MKKKIITLMLAVIGLLPLAGQAQIPEVRQLLLNVEKLARFKQLLKDMKTGYKVLNKGYSTIRDISQGNYSLHKAFLDGLLQVSPAVRNYKRVGDIIAYQEQMIKEYRYAYGRFRQDQNLSDRELVYLERVYANLFNESLRNIDELASVLTAGSMRMSDDERLQAIDRIYLDMQNKVGFLRAFNDDTRMLAVLRAKERNDIETLRGLYGIRN